MPNINHRVLTHLVREIVPEIQTIGVCNGLTSIWLQAILMGLEEEAHFHKRLDYIHEYLSTPGKSIKTLNADIQNIFRSLANKTKKTLSKNDLQKTDIRAFVENIAIHHVPKIIFNQFFYQNLKQELYPFTASKKMVENNTAIFVKDMGVLLPNKEELDCYFLELQNKLNTLSQQPRIAFMLGSDNHSVGVYFNPKTTQWHYFDVNHLHHSTHYCQQVSSQNLSTLIFNSFSDTDQYTGFSIKALSSIDFPDLGMEFKKITNRFLFNYSQTSNIENILTRRNSRQHDVLWFASKEGYVKIIHRLLLKKKRIHSINRLDDKASILNSSTPLMIACQNGHTETVSALLNKMPKEDIDLKSRTVTPFFMACTQRHEKITALLLNHGAQDHRNPLENIFLRFSQI